MTPAPLLNHNHPPLHIVISTAVVDSLVGINVKKLTVTDMLKMVYCSVVHFFQRIQNALGIASLRHLGKKGGPIKAGGFQYVLCMMQFVLKKTAPPLTNTLLTPFYDH